MGGQVLAEALVPLPPCAGVHPGGCLVGEGVHTVGGEDSGQRRVLQHPPGEVVQALLRPDRFGVVAEQEGLAGRITRMPQQPVVETHPGQLGHRGQRDDRLDGRVVVGHRVHEPADRIEQGARRQLLVHEGFLRSHFGRVLLEALPPALLDHGPALAGQHRERLRRLPHHGAHRVIAVAVEGVAVDGGETDITELAAGSQFCHQPLQPGRHGRFHQPGEQRGQRVGELFGDRRSKIEAPLRHRPVRRNRPDPVGQGCDRPRLHDGELAPGEHPLDVLRRAEVLGDGRPDSGQSQGSSVVQDGRAAQMLGHPARPRPRLRREGIDADRLVCRLTAQHPAVGDDDGVGVHNPGDNGLAESPGRGDDGLLRAAVGRVGREHDSGGVGWHQSLHDDGQRQPLGVDVPFGPVTDCPVRPQ